MKQSLLIIALFIGLKVQAQDYYFSNSGNDANIGCPISAPCATINKANTLHGTKHFAVGSTWFGTLVPFTNDHFVNWGSGGKPIITGFIQIGSWTSLGGGWYSATVPALQSTIQMLKVDTGQVAPGIYPRNSYLNYTSYTGNTSITATVKPPPFVPGTAQIIISKNYYTKDRYPILSVTGNTINYDNGGVAGNGDRAAGNGYKLMNSREFCTQNLDWYYNGTTKTIYMLFTGGDDPTHHVIQASALSYGISMTGSPVSNVTIDGLEFTGFNQWAIRTNSSSTMSNLTVQNNHMHHNGIAGMVAINQANITILNNESDHNSNGGIEGNKYTNWDVEGNNIHDNGMIVGLGVNLDGANTGSYEGYVMYNNASTNGIFKNNIILRSGYNGARIYGGSFVASNNYINGAGYIGGDNGLFYTHADGTTLPVFGERYFNNNILLNSYGTNAGTNGSVNLGVGIYSDDLSTYITVNNNVISNCSQAAHYWHNNQLITGSGNLDVNNGTGLLIAHDDIRNAGIPRNLDWNGNYVIGYTTSQYGFQLFSRSSNTTATDLTGFGTANNNYYATIATNLTFFQYLMSKGVTPSSKIMNLPGWRTATTKEGASTYTSITQPTLFVYNETNAPKNVSLGANYVSVTGTTHNAGTYTLAPYTGDFLIQTGTPIVAPVTTYVPSVNTYTIGTPISPLSPANTGGTPTGYSISPPLPSGIAINGTSGIVSGTPLVASPSTTYTITASNVAGVSIPTINLTLNGNRPNLSYPNSSYTFPISSAITPVVISNSGGAVIGSYSISQSLPSGLSFNTTSATISGTPTSLHSATTYSIIGSNVSGADTVQVSITVSNILPNFHYSPSTNSYRRNVAIAPLTPIQSGGSPTGYTITPSLPTGLNFSLVTGIISGTGTVTSPATSYAVAGTNSVGSFTTHVTLSVSNRRPPSRGIPCCKVKRAN